MTAVRRIMSHAVVSPIVFVTILAFGLTNSARADGSLLALIVETERELRRADPRRFDKMFELIDARASSPERAGEVAVYLASAADDVMVHYLSFALDLGLASRANYGRFLAEHMRWSGPEIRDRAFELATRTGNLREDEGRTEMLRAMDGVLAVAQDDERTIALLRRLHRCDEGFRPLEARLLTIRVGHPNPRVVAAAAGALYAVRGGGDPRGSLSRTLRAVAQDMNDRVRKLCESALYE